MSKISAHLQTSQQSMIKSKRKSSVFKEGPHTRALNCIPYKLPKGFQGLPTVMHELDIDKLSGLFKGDFEAILAVIKSAKDLRFINLNYAYCLGNVGNFLRLANIFLSMDKLEKVQLMFNSISSPETENGFIQLANIVLTNDASKNALISLIKKGVAIHINPHIPNAILKEILAAGAGSPRNHRAALSVIMPGGLLDSGTLMSFDQEELATFLEYITDAPQCRLKLSNHLTVSHAAPLNYILSQLPIPDLTWERFNIPNQQAMEFADIAEPMKANPPETILLYQPNREDLETLIDVIKNGSGKLKLRIDFTKSCDTTFAEESYKLIQSAIKHSGRKVKASYYQRDGGHNYVFLKEC